MDNINDLNRAIATALRKQSLKQLFFRHRSTLGDKIRMSVDAAFYEGTPQKPIKLICVTKGHMVDNGLIDFINYLSSNTTTIYGRSLYYAPGSSGIPTVPSIRLGTGAGTTAHGTTGLTTICNTPPSTVTGTNSNPSAGNWRMTYTATWNTGVIAAIVVTEAGLWLLLDTGLRAFAATSTASSPNLFDRISEADGDFTHFTVNVTKPLSLQYGINVAYS